MAEEIKAKVVETEEKSLQEKEEVVQKNSGFDEESQMYKVNLNEPPKQETDAVQGKSTDDSDVVVEQSEDSPSSEEVVEEVPSGEETVQDEQPAVEEITEEEKPVEETKEEVVEAIEEAKETGEPLPENIQKVAISGIEYVTGYKYSMNKNVLESQAVFNIQSSVNKSAYPSKSAYGNQLPYVPYFTAVWSNKLHIKMWSISLDQSYTCLLYTSDAADE